MLTRVGPGTPMGNLMRRFWIPALIEDEVALPDGPPVRLRLLGEDLVAFRDTEGNVGIVDGHCAHRRAGLYFGRNEEGGLRCVYHGWKFDVNGKCLDMPSEPHTSQRQNVAITAYPTAVRGGVVWVYMGPPEHRPALPDFEWSTLPRMQRTAVKRLAECNWAQVVEAGIDSAHVSFLHRSMGKDSSKAVLPATTAKYSAMDHHPVFNVFDAEHGLLITARRNADPGQYYWRITPFLVPFYTIIPPDMNEPFYYGHAWVPIDDESTWTWTFSACPGAEYSEEDRQFHGGRDGRFGPLDEQYRHVLNKDNDYGLDRERQRKVNYTGIVGIPTQDAAVTESMQPIVDRTKERLGHSDSGIVRFRRLMLGMAKDLMEGRPPAAANNGALYNMRSVSVLLPESVPVVEGTAALLRGASPTHGS
jgi:phenylpropionate dioxygenase-like ring-hydroxylating dioxygenase large terminal subunit